MFVKSVGITGLVGRTVSLWRVLNVRGMTGMIKEFRRKRKMEIKIHTDKQGWSTYLVTRWPSYQFWGFVTIIAILGKANAVLQLASVLFVLEGIFSTKKKKRNKGQNRGIDMTRGKRFHRVENTDTQMQFVFCDFFPRQYSKEG